jgi:hypothetical protein
MTKGHGSKMDRLQEQAVAALLAFPTVAKAAETVGVDESTLRTWLRDPDFRAAYRAARADVLERTVARLVAASVKAVEALERNRGAARAADQIRAALGILSHVTNGLAVSDLTAQVQELAARVQEDREQERRREQDHPPVGNGSRAWRPRPLGGEDTGDGNGHADGAGGTGDDRGDEGPGFPGDARPSGPPLF